MGFAMKGTVSACLVIFSCGSALGADLLRKGPTVISGPTPLSSAPASSWSGFYLGANAGGGMSYVSTQTLAEIVDQRFVATKLNMDRSGAMGGLQAGFALQSGAVVYGLEGDIGFGALRGSLNVATADRSASVNMKSSITSLGTLRGRVGYAFDNILLYGTGGFATIYHEGKAVSTTAAGVITAGAIKEWVPGWTLGVGSEYALSGNVSLKLEYLYARMSNKVLTQSVTHSLNLLRAGVNYRF